MNPGPSDNQQLFVSLCEQVLQAPNLNEPTHILVDFLNSVNVDTLDFNAPIGDAPLICKLALEIANSKLCEPLEIILQKADLGKINFKATVNYGGLGSISLLWLITFIAHRNPKSLETLIARADLSKMDWNQKLGAAHASCFWMLAKTGNKNLIDAFIAKNVQGLDFSSKPISPDNAKSVQQLINEAEHPAPHFQSAPPVANVFPPPVANVFPPPVANVFPPPVANVFPPPAPFVPFGPSLLARLTSFSMHPKSTGIVIGLTVAAMTLSHSWMFILGASILSGITASTFLYLRNEYYQNKLVRLPRVAAIPNANERRAFLEGEKAANSVSHYLLSYVRPLCWVKASAFGAGMQDELKYQNNPFYMKKPR